MLVVGLPPYDHLVLNGASRLQRLTLANGLRVVLAADHGAPVVAVTVHVDVGYRSEPEGRSGFAHLFEHLMFQGSRRLPRGEYTRRVQGAGGSFAGTTTRDYTEFTHVAPAGALDHALFLEADRLHGLALTDEVVRNEIAVVHEEIRLHVLNRPYGGFPWMLLPPVLYRTFANCHNGYGDVGSLAAVTANDCADFFHAHYCPGNIVLTVAGDVGAERATDLIDRHFSDIPARRLPPRLALAEPRPDSERRAEHVDRHALRPAVAIGFPLPAAERHLDAYVATMMLAALLTAGDTAPLTRRLLSDERLAAAVSASAGLCGVPLDARDPDALVVTAVLTSDATPDMVIASIDEELGQRAAVAPSEEQLANAAARLAASAHRERDRLADRAASYGRLELLFGRAELADELADRLAAVPPDAVVAAASALRRDSRAVLTVLPEETR